VLNSLAANVEGTSVVLATLSPMLRQRGPLQLEQARTAVDRLSHRIASVQARNRGAAWRDVPVYQREQINGYTAAAAEALAYVPELLDPRPLRPSQNPIAGAS